MKRKSSMLIILTLIISGFSLLVFIVFLVVPNAVRYGLRKAAEYLEIDVTDLKEGVKNITYLDIEELLWEIKAGEFEKSEEIIDIIAKRFPFLQNADLSKARASIRNKTSKSEIVSSAEKLYFSREKIRRAFPNAKRVFLWIV